MKEVLLSLCIILCAPALYAAGLYSKKEQKLIAVSETYKMAKAYFETRSEAYTLHGFETYLGRKLNGTEKKVFRKLSAAPNFPELTPEEEAAMIKNKRLGNYSLYLGIGAVALMFIPAIGVVSLLLFPAALITGIVAMGRAKQYKDRPGSGYSSALAGTIIGGLGIALIGIVLIALLSGAWI